MGASAMNLPPGFQLEDSPPENSGGMKLPPGFQLEQPAQSQPQPDSILDKTANFLRPIGEKIGQVSDYALNLPGMKYTPIGMSFQANNAIQSGFDLAGKQIPGFDQAGEKVAEKIGGIQNVPSIFKPAQPYIAAGVGTVVQNIPAIAQGVAQAMSPKEPIFKKATPANPILKKAVSWAADVPEDSAGFKLENPELVRTARPLADIAAKDVPAAVGKFNQVIEGLHGEAKKSLSTSSYLEPSAGDMGGAFTKDEVIGAVKNARTNLGGVYTPEAQAAANTLERISENLKKVRSTVSQNQVHDLIVDLDREIPWDKVTKAPEQLTLQDNALIKTRNRLDNLLKAKNPTYAEITKPLSEAIQNRNEFTRNFDVKKIKGAGYQSGNQTVSRLFGATNEDRLATQRILGNTKNTIGEDLNPRIKAAQVKADFEPDSGGVFKPTGVKQIFGRPIASKAIDIGSAVGKSLEKTPDLSVAASALRVLTPSKAREYLEKAGKDKALARKMALADGYKIP